MRDKQRFTGAWLGSAAFSEPSLCESRDNPLYQFIRRQQAIQFECVSRRFECIELTLQQ